MARTLHAGTLLLFFICGITYIRGGAPDPTFDDAWYLETAYRIYDSASEGLGGFLASYTGALKIKAPLIAVIPLPFFALFGRTLEAALIAQLLATIIAGYYCFRLGRRMFSTSVGALSAAIYLTMPLTYGMSRVVFAEAALSACVLATLDHLYSSDGFRRNGHSLMVGLLSGAGMLLKILFPVYVLAPAAIILWRAHRRGRFADKEEWLTGSRIAFFTVLAVSLSWYAENWLTAVGFAARAGLGDLGAHYGGETEGFLRYLCFSRNVFAHAAGPAFGMALLFALPRCMSFGKGRAAFLAAWIVPAWLLFSFQVAGEMRYAAPLLPALAIVCAAGLLDWSEQPALRVGFTIVALALPLDMYAAQTFGKGLIHLPGPVAYSLPPGPSADPGRQGVVEWFAGTAGRVAVAIEHPHLNANNLSMEAARLGSAATFHNLGHAQRHDETAWIRMKEKGTTHLLVAEGFSEKEMAGFLNQVNESVASSAEKGRFGFTRVGTIPLSAGRSLRVYERPSAE